MDQQRYPSLARIATVFETEDMAKMARKVMEMSRNEILRVEAGLIYEKSCHNPPPLHNIRMHVLNSLDPALHGVESVEIKGEYGEYLNTGQMYAPTIILWRGNFRVQDLGTFIENIERGKKK